MGKKSTQVALGGLAASLCTLLMFLTGMIPFATYALPAAAGIVLVAVVVENGASTAALVYAAASILAFFVVPDREAALMFIFFFGYYPILKFRMDRISFKPLQYFLKFLLFNVAVVIAYLIVIYLFGIADILESFGDFGRYSVLVLLLMGNVVFAIYDFALTNLIWAYLYRLRPRIFRRCR